MLFSTLGGVMPSLTTLMLASLGMYCRCSLLLVKYSCQYSGRWDIMTGSMSLAKILFRALFITIALCAGETALRASLASLRASVDSLRALLDSFSAWLVSTVAA